MPSFIGSPFAEYIAHDGRGSDGAASNGRRLCVAALAIICAAMASTLAAPPLVSRALRSAYLSSDAPRAGAAPILGAGGQGSGRAVHKPPIAHSAPPALKSRTVRYAVAWHSVAGAGHAALVRTASDGVARLAAPVLSAGAHASKGLPSFAPTLLLLSPAAAAAVAALLRVCRPRSQAEDLWALASEGASTAPQPLMDHVEELAAGAKHEWQHSLVLQMVQQISKDAHDITPIDYDNVEAAPPLEDSLGEGMRAAAHNLEKVVGIDMDQLTALCRSASYLSLEDPDFHGFLVDQSEYKPMMRMRMLLDLFQTSGFPNDAYVPIDKQGLALIRNRLLEWVTAKRGRDLFIPGLGGFDVKQVYHDDLLARRAFMDAGARAADEALLLYDWSEVPRDMLFQPDRVVVDILARQSVQISAAARYHLLGWVPSPAELQASAYFPALRADWLRHQKVASILALPDTNPLRMHLIRHRDWWNDVHHIDALDEIELVMGPSVSPTKGVGIFFKPGKLLAEAGVFGFRALAQLDRQQRRALLPELREMSPAQLRQSVAHARRVVPDLPLRWPDGGEAMDPDTLLDRMCPSAASAGGRGYDPGTGFDHLDQLPDGAMDRDGHVLRVLRDPKTVADVGEWLDNCAADYTDACQGGRYILVALCDGGGDPYALGGYRYAEGAGWRADHVVRCGNAPPGPNVRQKFEEFVTVIRRWARDRRRMAESESGSLEQ